MTVLLFNVFTQAPWKQSPRMSSAVIDEFRFSLPLDNGLLIADVKNGVPINSAEILSLSAIAEALYVTVAITSRGLGQIRQCFELWRDATALFSELSDSWTDVGSNDPQIRWMRGELQRLEELCRDRVELYSITESDRREFAERRAADSDNEHAFGTRGDIEPVREFSKLETASIERAYRRL
jgi:hypothetical protein